MRRMLRYRPVWLSLVLWNFSERVNQSKCSVVFKAVSALSSPGQAVPVHASKSRGVRAVIKLPSPPLVINLSESIWLVRSSFVHFGQQEMRQRPGRFCHQLSWKGTSRNRVKIIVHKYVFISLLWDFCECTFNGVARNAEELWLWALVEVLVFFEGSEKLAANGRCLVQLPQGMGKERWFSLPPTKSWRSYIVLTWPSEWVFFILVLTWK